MKRRTVKKVANRFLNTGKLPFRYISRVEEYPEGNGYWKAEIVVRSEKLRSAIRAAAFRRGWDGNHWDNPLVSVEYVD